LSDLYLFLTQIHHRHINEGAPLVGLLAAGL
jgi:hypothetical protein